MSHYEDCNSYLNKRTGTYEFRCRRYGLIVDRLSRMGLNHGDVVVDVGAGRCEFGRYLREAGWHCHYIPFDGSIDGVDLDRGWRLPFRPHFAVAIEFIEHLTHPFLFMRRLLDQCQIGVAVTTPNPAEVDVLAMDATHKSPVTETQLRMQGFFTQALQLFTEDKRDTIVAYKAHFTERRIRE